ncbi:MAG: hypothetical protein JW871_03370 [Endomicrobiales bacterium]|nr:hypothetical protein [Endomicrobiales bacterium]
MSNNEEKILNKPAKNFFENKIKCEFAKNEFRFSAGTLDLVAYNRKQKCFHVGEGKLAHRVSSVGHAVGQLIAYISMIQESGFDFLDRISKEANLYLTDFTDFLENKAIKVCFYIILPEKLKSKILGPAELMLGNIGDFGESIGIMFAKYSKCELYKEAKPINIKIRKLYSRDELYEAVKNKLLVHKESRGLEVFEIDWPRCLKFREIGGNPNLHFEIWHKHSKKGDKFNNFEIAFHLEWNLKHIKKKHKTTYKRARTIIRRMKQARTTLKRNLHPFVFTKAWGEGWAKLFTTYQTKSENIDNEDLNYLYEELLALVKTLLPKLKKISWGRKTHRLEENKTEFD